MSRPKPTAPGALAAIRSDPNRIAWINGVWAAFASAHPTSVHLADYNALLCTRPERSAIRPDGVTFSTMGAREVWSWLVTIARPIASEAKRR